MLGTGLLSAVMLGLAIFCSNSTAACATSFDNVRVNQRNQRTQADGGGTAPESTIATVCGSDAQDPPIVADRKKLNRRHRGARILQADRVLIFQLGSDGSGK